MCEIETRTVYFSIVCDRKYVQKEELKLIFIQSEDLDPIDVSKKVYTCAYIRLLTKQMSRIE